MVEYTLVEQFMNMEQEMATLVSLYLVSSSKGGRGERTWRGFMLLCTHYFFAFLVPPPSDIAIMPTTQSVNHSSNASFTCTVTSLTQPTVMWSINATTGITTHTDVLAFSQGSNTYN